MLVYEKSIEAILFAAGEPVAAADIADALETNILIVKQSVKSLMKKYAETNAGILITETGGCYQMHTNPLYFDVIKKLYIKPKKKALTQTLMETLAIIAFKQPISRPQIEEIRGVSADHAVNRLIELNLVEETGRLDMPGRPIAFGTTSDFLRHFGFTTLDEMVKEISSGLPESEPDNSDSVQVMLEDI